MHSVNIYYDPDTGVLRFDFDDAIEKSGTLVNKIRHIKGVDSVRAFGNTLEVTIAQSERRGNSTPEFVTKAVYRFVEK
jgi:hypothetical protein